MISGTQFCGRSTELGGCACLWVPEHLIRNGNRNKRVDFLPSSFAGTIIGNTLELQVLVQLPFSPTMSAFPQGLEDPPKDSRKNQAGNDSEAAEKQDQNDTEAAKRDGVIASMPLLGTHGDLFGRVGRLNVLVVLRD